MDQGETVMKALQDAVPEDVRGKLTAAVSGFFHNQGTNFKLDGLLNIGSLCTMVSGQNQEPGKCWRTIKCRRVCRSASLLT